jgi:hypothetical protein
MMANGNAKSRLSSGTLNADIDLLTFLASLISSLASPGLLFVAGEAFCTVFTALFAVSTIAEVVDRTDEVREFRFILAKGVALRGMVCRRRQTEDIKM